MARSYLAGLAVAGLVGMSVGVHGPALAATRPVATTQAVAAKVSPASLARCEARARQARTACVRGPVISGARCTASQVGFFSLTRTSTLVVCKRSWGSVFTWVWA